MSRIAIIDSGINKDDAVCKLNIVQSLSIYINENNEITEKNISNCNNPHGTIVAEIITQINPSAEIIDVNILDNELRTNGHVLLYAIKKAIDLKPDIINLSLGTNSLKYILPMKRLVKKAIKSNIYIVAAYDNCDRLTFPAVLKDVIGVKRISTLNISDNKYAYRKKIFYALDNNIFVNKMNSSKINCAMQGNSMSAAYITGQLSLLIEQNNKLSVKEAVNQLKYNICNYMY